MWSLRPISYSALSGWKDDDHGAALAAFQRQALKPIDERYKTGSIGITPAAFDPLIALSQRPEAIKNPRHFFEDNFSAYKLVCHDEKRGQVTGFYEPEVDAQRGSDAQFATPLLRRPDDLIVLNESNRPSTLSEDYRFGRRDGNGNIVEYYDRAAINRGAIDVDDLAIAWIKDPVDAFFIHVQGAARLNMGNGETVRITYDGKSGHPFTAIGKNLIERGEIAKDQISMQSIRAWLSKNPDKATALMEENRSYIFFKEAPSINENLGPIAAAKVPLTTERSLAVDRLIHTFGTPIFVQADTVNNAPFQHLMIAQETGTAIVGPSRGDIFFGSGDLAGEKAGAVNSLCDFTILVPRGIGFDEAGIQLP
ncbi:murein transglycosylase A [Ahrensia kielensis]|uniref:murein transglycosylase A n=1 Tax=Ahrensia kielensis TaxID=76980 RepID=UPI000375616E|nr:MltA domain-containing protein [Ahrensia kielensis]